MMTARGDGMISAVILGARGSLGEPEGTAATARPKTAVYSFTVALGWKEESKKEVATDDGCNVSFLPAAGGSVLFVG